MFAAQVVDRPERTIRFDPEGDLRHQPSTADLAAEFELRVPGHMPPGARPSRIGIERGVQAPAGRSMIGRTSPHHTSGSNRAGTAGHLAVDRQTRWRFVPTRAGRRS